MKWQAAAFCFFLSGCSAKSIPIDSKPPAKEGPEPTIIFIGCDTISKGYLFCPLREGTDMSHPLRIVFPQVECSRDSCAVIQIIHKSGAFGKSFSLPKSQTLLFLTLADLTGFEGIFSKEQGGEYRIVSEVFYQVNGEPEKVTHLQGIVRIWPLGKDYQSLSCEDPERAWAVPIVKHCKAEFSTGGRSELCGECGGV